MLSRAANLRGFIPKHTFGGFRTFSSLSGWSTVKIDNWNGKNPHRLQNLVQGQWKDVSNYQEIPDCLNGDTFMHVPLTTIQESQIFSDSLAECPKTGLHNPFRSVDRYLMLGQVSDRAGHALRTPEIKDYFTRLIMRTSPKSYKQAEAEVNVCAQFLDNFSGDSVRFLARGFSVPGDHDGQRSHGYRFPYGPVALIAPFNFPLEIPLLQAMGALYMGNKPIVKVDSKVSVVFEEFVRLLHACGLPKEDLDLIHSDGETMNHILLNSPIRMTLFTGSSKVAEKLAVDLRGKIKLEDAGFDWKVFGPDVPTNEAEREYVAWTCDQDAYACSGQKCSAQSIVFAHKNWVDSGLFKRMEELSKRRKLDNLTIGPVLTWSTEKMLAHVDALLKIPGAKLLFGGKELNNGNHTIPKIYGAIEPTAVFVPLKEIVKKEHFATVATEVFGPFQVVTEWETDEEFGLVQHALESMENHLTAAIVSKDQSFINKVIGTSVNGTTYVGLRARTTGAPQNHWFGPSGDPRGAGIGTKEAIQLVWSSHREIIEDIGPIPSGWTLPEAT